LPAVFDLVHIFGLHEVGDDAVGGPLGDAERARDVAKPYAGVLGDAQHSSRVVRQEAPGHVSTIPERSFLELIC